MMGANRSSQRLPCAKAFLTRPVGKRTTTIVYATLATMVLCLVLPSAMGIVQVLTRDLFRPAAPPDHESVFEFREVLADAVTQQISLQEFRSSFGKICTLERPVSFSDAALYTHSYVHPENRHIHYLRFEEARLAAWRAGPCRYDSLQGAGSAGRRGGRDGH